MDFTKKVRGESSPNARKLRSAGFTPQKNRAELSSGFSLELRTAGFTPHIHAGLPSTCLQGARGTQVQDSGEKAQDFMKDFFLVSSISVLANGDSLKAFSLRVGDSWCVFPAGLPSSRLHQVPHLVWVWRLRPSLSMVIVVLFGVGRVIDSLRLFLATSLVYIFVLAANPTFKQPSTLTRGRVTRFGQTVVDRGHLPKHGQTKFCRRFVERGHRPKERLFRQASPTSNSTFKQHFNFKLKVYPLPKGGHERAPVGARVERLLGFWSRCLLSVGSLRKHLLGLCLETFGCG